MARPRNQRPSERDLWGETLALLGATPDQDLTTWQDDPVGFCRQVRGKRGKRGNSLGTYRAFRA